jgi:chromosomal replication initiator protein
VLEEDEVVPDGYIAIPELEELISYGEAIKSYAYERKIPREVSASKHIKMQGLMEDFQLYHKALGAERLIKWCQERGMEVVVKERATMPDYYISPNYKFQSFIVEKFNKEAYLLARRVAESDTANGIAVISSADGMGRNHLLQAVMWEKEEQQPDKLLHYLDSETFLWEMNRAKSFGELEALADYYKNVDFLVFNDIDRAWSHEDYAELLRDILSKRTIEHKQTLIGVAVPFEQADQWPENITMLLEVWDMAMIYEPDMEAKRSIIEGRIMSKRMKEYFRDDVIEEICKRAYNIRVLIGEMNRVIALAKLTDVKK